MLCFHVANSPQTFWRRLCNSFDWLIVRTMSTWSHITSKTTAYVHGTDVVDPRFFMFEIRNRLTLQSKNNVCKSDVKIEDWAYSLIAHTHGPILQTVFVLSIASNRAKYVCAIAITKRNYLLMCNHKIYINIMLCLWNSTGHIHVEIYSRSVDQSDTWNRSIYV